MIPRTPEQDRSIAIHEAGHAFAALLLCIDFDRVTIQRDHECEGHVALTSLPDEGDWLADLTMHAYAIHMLAGPAAERAFAAREAWGAEPEAGDSDMRAVRDAAERISHGHKELANRFVALWELQAEILVEQHADNIDRLARALIAKRTLTADEAHNAQIGFA